MAQSIVDFETWPRTAQFRFFRTFQRPHFAVTSRLDVSHLIGRKSDGVSPYRACLFAIAVGLQSVPALRMRFHGETVVLHDGVTVSMTVPRADGSFGFGHVQHRPDFAGFDAAARTQIDTVRAGTDYTPDTDQSDVAFLSCLPWLDYTAYNNALPGPEDCTPRVTWGRFVERTAGRFEMSMTLEVHHALADGSHVGAFFKAVQDTLDTI